MQLVANAIVGGHFRLVRKLGEGGMGVVWSAIDERATEPVALKFLRADALAESDAVRRFLREAKTALRLAHPNIVRAREVVKLEDGAPAMVMDLLEGESLAARLAREGALAVPEFARIYLQILSAVGSAHAAGIVHRDLKPDNVFLLADGGEHDVRVLDFGIAKFRAPEGEGATTALTGTGAMLGTPFYMAPEQVFGERDVDHRVDVWALGVILYECLSGRRPFAGENFGQVFKAITRGELSPLSTIAPRLPRDLLDVCARMLETERDKRLSDLREVFELVRKYTDIDAQIFSAPTLPLGASRDDLTEAFAPTLAADTGAALARSGQGSAFPPSAPRPRWPLAVALVLVSALGATAVLLTRAPPSREAAVAAPAGPAPSELAPANASAIASAIPSASAPAIPSASAQAIPSTSAAPRPKPVAAPTATPSAAPPAPSSTPTAPPSATSLAGGVAPKPPF